MLEKIKGPEDVKKLCFQELTELAEDVRQRIIEITSKNGGHVAPSLGATDFIIALLKVFNPLHDNIVFDVGHQAYAYKILTGRNESFDTLRTLGGISGFNNIFESKYDSFTVGHASTSISATLGIAIAKEQKSLKGNSIAVIGDGALTGGMAFEALNNAGHMQKNIIVILNDNEMSISQNVGALQNYMTNVLVSKSYNSMKKQVWDLSQSLPDKVRRTFIYGAQKIEESLMNIIVPNIIFEDLGFKYVGPIDGHDIPRLCRIFMKAKDNIVGPILIHLITQKGRGYSHSETDSTKYHGVGPYNQETGKTDSFVGKSWSQVFGDKLCEMAEKNKDIVAITAAMGDGTGLKVFSEKYKTKFFDVGIAEQHAVTLAAGMAIKGLRPFVAIYSSFMQRALDQVIHDVALQKLPVVFCIDRAGVVGEDGFTHHGVFDLSFLQFIPNLTIIAPATDKELQEALDWSIEYKDGPVAIRYPRGIACNDLKQTPIENKEYTIAITGVGHSFETANKLYEMILREFVEVGQVNQYSNENILLLNPIFLKPYNKEIYDKVYKECKYHIVIEENAEIGGFASRLALDHSLSECKTLPFGVPDYFIEHGKIEELRDIIGLTAEKIYQNIKDLIK
ncbi:MAG: 1-deoxy-D-xylulose-5-phosphate synthase [Candidatus Cloacimonetes bacterium]|nr:1-deoxy-D-xylulose-5-phosphate synthase [Candidatus Cloacimonadota bacterium]